MIVISLISNKRSFIAFSFNRLPCYLQLEINYVCFCKNGFVSHSVKGETQTGNKEKNGLFISRETNNTHTTDNIQSQIKFFPLLNRFAWRVWMYTRLNILRLRLYKKYNTGYLLTSYCVRKIELYETLLFILQLFNFV